MEVNLRVRSLAPVEEREENALFAASERDVRPQLLVVDSSVLGAKQPRKGVPASSHFGRRSLLSFECGGEDEDVSSAGQGKDFGGGAGDAEDVVRPERRAGLESGRVKSGTPLEDVAFAVHRGCRGCV